MIVGGVLGHLGVEVTLAPARLLSMDLDKFEGFPRRQGAARAAATDVPRRAHSVCFKTARVHLPCRRRVQTFPGAMSLNGDKFAR
jgi:hypothetical protein